MSWSPQSFADQQGPAGELFTLPWTKDHPPWGGDDASLIGPPAPDGSEYHGSNASPAWAQWDGTAPGASLELHGRVDLDERLNQAVIYPESPLVRANTSLLPETPWKTLQSPGYLESSETIFHHGDNSHRVDEVSETAYGKMHSDELLALRLNSPTTTQPSQLNSLIDVARVSSTSRTRTDERLLSLRRTKRKVSQRTRDVERPKRAKRKHDSVEKKFGTNVTTSDTPYKSIGHGSRQSVSQSRVPTTAVLAPLYHSYSKQDGISAADTSEYSCTGIIKLSDRQMRNRKAAERSRAKSNASTQQLREDEHLVSTLNRELNEELNHLTREVLRLRSEISEHMNCNCVLIQTYVSVAMEPIGHNDSGLDGSLNSILQDR